MENEKIRLRPALPDDCRMVFTWANDAAARAASFQSHSISYEEHRDWFAARIADGSSLFIIEAGDEPVGVTRLDASGADTAEVSINLANAARGRGLGAIAIKAILRLARVNGFQKLIARVRADNARSQRVFKKSGFCCEGADVVHGHRAFVFSRQTTDDDPRIG